jgi:hypothetical protein
MPFSKFVLQKKNEILGSLLKNDYFKENIENKQNGFRSVSSCPFLLFF